MQVDQEQTAATGRDDGDLTVNATNSARAHNEEVLLNFHKILDIFFENFNLIGWAIIMRQLLNTTQKKKFNFN